MMGMETGARRDWSGWLLLPLVLTALVYLGTTTDRGVTDYDEAYYAQPAVRMAAEGDWVTPYANGVRFLEKPPLLYWVTAGSFKAFGIHEVALRLPTALAVIALVWVVMLTARRAFGGGAAGAPSVQSPPAGGREGAAGPAVAVAGLATAFSVGTYLFTRETLHDIWLVLFLAVAMYALLEWTLLPGRTLRPALLFYAAMAGAFMCKSLVGVAFPAGIAVLFCLVSRRRPSWRSLHLLSGTLLFLALTVPWHWLAEVRNEGFLGFFFVGEQFLRFLGRREPPVLWSVPLGTFLGLIPVWFFPWTVFLPAAFSGDRRTRGGNTAVLLRLALVWIVVVVGFFSLSDRLEHYVFPALPAFALLAAAAFYRKGESRALLWGFRALAAVGVLALLGGIVAGAWLAAGNELPSGAAGPSDRLSETDFSIMAEMPPDLVRQLAAPAAVTVLVLSIGFLSALMLEKRRRRKAAVAAVAAVMVAVCALTHWSLVLCEDLISSKRFGLAVASEALPGDRLVVMDDYESANSLSFYQPLRVEVTDGTAYALLPGLRFPDAPKLLLTPGEFGEAWRSEGRVFALLPEEKLGRLDPAGIEVLRLPGRVLVKNR